jgi:hypothetical protein
MSTQSAKIHDYPIIGDGRSAALVSKRRSLNSLLLAAI